MSGMGPLDDEYALGKEGSEELDEECADGCIYRRDSNPDDEYCFINKKATGLVQCEVLLDHQNNGILI